MYTDRYTDRNIGKHYVFLTKHVVQWKHWKQWIIIFLINLFTKLPPAFLITFVNLIFFLRNWYLPMQVCQNAEIIKNTISQHPSVEFHHNFCHCYNNKLIFIWKCLRFPEKKKNLDQLGAAILALKCLTILGVPSK